MQLDCKTESKRIIKFIKDEFKKRKFTQAVLGISGGIDSAVIAALLCKALGSENVHGYILPFGNQHDIKDAKSVFTTYGIPFNRESTFSIEDAVYNFISDDDDKKRLGNIMARCRMIYLYDMSAKHNALVIGTGNKTELMLGYFTHHGDGACAMEPIGHLYKTEVKQLAKYLMVPEAIQTKAPSAGLWDGQTDEGELEATYHEIDLILSAIEDQNHDTSHKLTRKLMDMIINNSFKSEIPASLERSK